MSLKTKTLILLTLLSSICNATIRYARPNGTGNGDSWAQSSSDLQILITNSASGDTIWVSEGIYKPCRPADSLNLINLNSRKNSFVLKSGVKMLGGFPQNGTPLLADRNSTLYPSVLSGDLGNVNDTTDNTFHVVISTNNNDESHLDGFTITGGNANQSPTTMLVDGNAIANFRGGGMMIFNSDIRISNVVYSKNSALSGGAVYSTGNSAPVFRNVTFIDNIGTQGGAIYNVQSLISFYDVEFRNNYSKSDGGGLFNAGTQPKIDGAYFFNNRAVYSGGAIINTGGQALSKYKNIVFDSNSATSGGAIFNELSTIAVTNCLFKNNYATSVGGAIVSGINSQTVYTTNCTFYGNKAQQGGALSLSVSIVPPKISNCIFYNNQVTLPGYELTRNFKFSGSLDTLIVSHSLIDTGDTLLVGTYGNITDAPIFKDAASGDFRLSCGSPGINMGSSSVYAPGQTPNLNDINRDIAGNYRFSNGNPDMGAYEYQFEGDTISEQLCRNDSYLYNGVSYNPPFVGYIDTFVNEDGCDSFIVLNLSSLSADTSLTLRNDSLFSNELGATYKWINCTTNNIIPNATEYYYHPSVPGYYQVVINKNGCSDTSKCFPFQVTGIKEIEYNYGLKIYPNPTAGTLNIDNNTNSALKSITIFTITGHELNLQKRFNSKTYIVNTRSLPSGVYFIKASWETGIVTTHKFLKQ